MRRIEGFIWADWVVDKLDWKHHVAPDEVEETFFNPPYKVRRTKGDKYLLYGRQMMVVTCLSFLHGKTNRSK